MLYQIFPACFPRLAEKKRPLRISRRFPFDRYYI